MCSYRETFLVGKQESIPSILDMCASNDLLYTINSFSHCTNQGRNVLGIQFRAIYNTFGASMLKQYK